MLVIGACVPCFACRVSWVADLILDRRSVVCKGGVILVCCGSCPLFGPLIHGALAQEVVVCTIANKKEWHRFSDATGTECDTGHRDDDVKTIFGRPQDTFRKTVDVCAASFVECVCGIQILILGKLARGCWTDGCRILLVS